MSRGALLAVLVLTTVLSASIATPRAQTPTPSDLAARIQTRYATVRDFTADFAQRETSPLLPKPVLERGTVKVKKPGRMRWTYATGDRNETVSDGTTVHYYFRADRHVTTAPLPADNEASTALLFLTGRGNLSRDFTPTLPADQPAGEWRLELRPRTPQSDFEVLTLEVDRTSLAFRGLIVTDAQGGTSAFRFTAMRENVGLADREFMFTVPRGVEVR